MHSIIIIIKLNNLLKCLNNDYYYITFTFTHLADAFIKATYIAFKLQFISSAFPGNRTHDLGVASAMLYHLSYRKAIIIIIIITIIIIIIIFLVLLETDNKIETD